MIRLLASLLFVPVAPGLALWQMVLAIAVICWSADLRWKRAMAEQDRRIRSEAAAKGDRK